MDSEYQWYCIMDSDESRRQEGPLSAGNLASMLSAGTLSAETLVWQEGMADWAQIGTLPDFGEPDGMDAAPPAADATPLASPAAESEPEPEPDAAAPGEQPDTVLVMDAGSHTVEYSLSRNALLIATNDYHAGPLVLSKLDLLGFLTVMETAAGRGAASAGT